jgi:hypothetical protein
MREIRPSGSEGGGAGLNRLSLPLSTKRPSGTDNFTPPCVQQRGLRRWAIICRRFAAASPLA